MAFYTLIKVVDRSVVEGEYGSDAEALQAFGARVGDKLTLVGDGAASYVLGRRATSTDKAVADTPVFSVVGDDALRSIVG